MAVSRERSIARLRIIYRDAHHCEPPTDQHAIDWAARPELWAEHQIRYRNWSWHVCEAVVKECRRLSNCIKIADTSLVPLTADEVGSYPIQQ